VPTVTENLHFFVSVAAGEAQNEEMKLANILTAPVSTGASLTKS